MRILLLGQTGLLGKELKKSLSAIGKVFAPRRTELDLTNVGSIRAFIEDNRPEVVVNAAAYTAVDEAEDEQGLASEINTLAPAALAEETDRIGAALIHYSTDYVFDGKKGEPYTETDQPNPLNIYGRTKLAGELAIKASSSCYLIIRTSWLYSLNADCFVAQVLSWAREREVMRIVDDQIGSPTWSRVLADRTAKIINKTAREGIGWLEDRSGVYHIAGIGGVSRWEWAEAILDLDPDKAHQKVRELERARSDEFTNRAPRPYCSILDCSRFQETFDMQLPEWKAALRMAMVPP